MSNYPKIYSISTVGIRQHDNADYLLHSVRTDFTGNNGLGKSIIADLLQLVFVPLRDEWKPGTEGLDKEKRKIETIPLEKDWINHAYCFLNIEKSKGKFITIGAFIPRTTRVPIRPFIIQQGDDFENKKNELKPFSHILTSSDFISDNGHIYDLIELKRNLNKKYNLFLKDFYQREQVNEYFELLFKNQILPIDLTKENNLKSFAKVLQSFSKAKTLDITKSKSLQDFLFEDNEDIKTAFDTRKETLNQHIRNFHRADQDIKSLEKKQEKLSQLKITHDNYTRSKEEYLTQNAHFQSNKYNTAQKVFSDNENKKNKAYEDFNIAKKDFETQSQESYQRMIDQNKICNEIRTRLEEQQAESGRQNLEKLKSQLQKEKTLIEKLELLKPIVNEYTNLKNIETGFHEQQKAKEQQKKIYNLKAIVSFELFRKSKWIEDFNLAYQHYNDRNAEIEESIKNLLEVLSLYDGSNPDSLFNWAIKEKKELSIEQETVIMSFKEIYIKRISSSQGRRFTINPITLLNSFEKEGNGIWINLGDVSEYFPLVKKQIFNDSKKLKQAIENDKEKIKQEISKLENEKKEINSLNSELINIGYNQEYCLIFRNQENIDKIKINKLFTEENFNFIIERFTLFQNLESLQIETKNLDLEITKIIENTAIIDSEINQNNKVLKSILIDISDLKTEISTPSEKPETDYKTLTKEKLIESRNLNEEELKGIEKTRGNTRKKRDDQLNAYNTAENLSTSLSEAKSKAEAHFKEARVNLEEQTELKFDALLPMGNITEEEIVTLKLSSENAERIFEVEFTSIAGLFDESKPENKRPEIYNSDGLPNYSFQTLVDVLCGKIGIDGLTKELSELNKTLLTLGDLQLKILTEVFSLVEKQYKEHEDTIRRLNFFFEKNKVSDVFRFRVDFESRKDINIDWIEKMKDKTRVQKLGPDLFTPSADLPSNENTPEKLIRNIAKTFYNSINVDSSDLLNPKFYFTLKVKMEDESGKSNSGSGGQAYTALALLCIGRLSIVQKHQDKNQGVKFIIIEELSNIDDTNFNIFPEIARQFGYQLMTMTPKPFGSYTNEEWYLHMLVKGKEDKERNYTPMSFFKTKYKKVELDKYINEQNELEDIKTA